MFRMAFRNLGRNRRRTLFSMLAVALGTALVLFLAAFVEGEIRGALDLTILLETGDIQVRAATYDEDKFSLAWEDLVEEPEQVAAQLEDLPQVRVATPRLRANGILSARDQTAGVTVLGIDPNSEASLPFAHGIVDGMFLTADDREGLLVGQPLAESLGVGVGDRVNLLVNTANGDVDEQTFVVRGIFSTHTPGYDKSTILLPLAKAQTFTRTEGHASLIFILLNDRQQADALAAAIQDPRYEVLTWRDLNELLIQTESLANAYMVVYYLIVIAITASVITNTLVMAVFERTREIGILAALGMMGRQILSLFMLEATLMAVGSVAAGLLLGGASAAYFGVHGIPIGDIGAQMSGLLFGDAIYPYLTLDDTLTVSLIALGVTLLAALYPAILATRLEPVEALHAQR